MKKVIAAALAGLSFIFGNARAGNTDNNQTHLALAMVVLQDAKLPDPRALSEYIRATWPWAKLDFDPEEKDGTIFLSGDDKELSFISLMPAPIPWGDLEYPCASALGWDDACSELEKGNAHIIIMVGGDSDGVIANQVRVTMLAQACSHLSKSIGVYIGEASTVWRAATFESQSLAMSPDEPPLLLWIGLKFSRDDDGKFSALTMGLKQYGRMNVETLHSQKAPEDVIEFTTNIPTYLAKTDEKIRNGDTVGFTADEKIRLTYEPSIMGSGDTVYRLHY
jgi:hypothetical protein